MYTKKITVLIPCFNVQSYINEALESILAQDFDDIEIICIDDCSTDGTYGILIDFSAKDNRVKVLQQSQNKGQGSARNVGLAHASGKYIFFFDSDDIIPTRDALSKLYKIAEEDNSDIVMGKTLRWNMETDERVQGYHKEYQQKELRKTNILHTPELAYAMTVWNKLIRHAFIKQNNIFFIEEMIRYEDLDYSCRLIVSAKSISFIPYTTYTHRRHPESVTHTNTIQDSFYYLQAVLNITTFLANKKNYSPPFEKRVKYYIDWAISNFSNAKQPEKTDENKKILLNILKEIVLRAEPEFLPSYIKNAREFLLESNFEKAYLSVLNETEKPKIEKLRSANEKLRSANEKLRKKNEELKVKLNSRFSTKILACWRVFFK